MYEEKFGYKGDKGLEYVNFYMRPHLNSPYSPKSRKEFIEKTAKEVPQTIYAIDDQTAIKVMGGKIEIVGEGEYIVFNEKS